MAVSPTLFYIIVSLIVLGSSVGLFLIGLRLNARGYKKWFNLCNAISLMVLFMGAMAAYVSLDDRSSDVDIVPSLIIANEDGSLTSRKIITPSYKGIPVRPKFRGGLYIVENNTNDTIEVVTAFYHFYGQSGSNEDSPKIESVLSPQQASIVDSKPVAIVGQLPEHRYFKVSKLGYSGHGRTVTYIIRH